MDNKPKEILSHWHRYFDEVPFTPQSFYKAVEETIKAKALPNVICSRIVYPEGGIFSANREYLRVQCKAYIFDICAAPFAKGFFVSWWMGELPDTRTNFLSHLPVIGRVFTKRKKTFFELDNENLFKDSVSTVVRMTFETMTENKGLRKLSEAEWQQQGIQHA